jgi:TatD DNase family protein
MADQEYHGYPAVLHCFTGNLQEAKGVLDRGWYLSLSGIVTFKKSESLREVAKYIPFDRLLIETDSPYLAPQSHRGKLNEPSYLPETAQVLAETRGITIEKLASITEENAEQFFSFSKVL